MSKWRYVFFYITTNEAKMNDIQYLEINHIFNIIVEYFIMPSLRSARK